MAAPRSLRPADFAERAAAHTSLELAAHYRVSNGVIARWRREVAIISPAATNQIQPLPANFVAVAPTLTRYEAKLFFNRGDVVLSRWAGETGVRFRNPVSIRSRATAGPINHCDNRDMSRAGQAAYHLLKYGPIYRCDAAGHAMPDGFFWRRNMAVLTDAEVIERAERLGWDEHAWRRIAA